MRKGKVPPGGWNAGSFARTGSVLLLDLVRVSRYSRRRKQGGLTATVEAVLLAQMNQVCDLAVGAGKAPDELLGDLPGSDEFWVAILAQVFGDTADIAIEQAVLPDITSLVSQGLNKTAAMMGVSLAPEAARETVSITANQLAREVVGVNATTRAQLAKILHDSVVKGLTIRDTVKVLREEFPDMAHDRAATIARTELNMAYTVGARSAFKATPGLTHISVIGCTGLNDSNHFYMGRHTCNIKMVPIRDIDQLRYHPNHVGTEVPAKFQD